MDPDVFVTIAFSTYAALAALGIGVVLRATSTQPDAGGSDDASRAIVEASHASAPRH